MICREALLSIDGLSAVSIPNAESENDYEEYCKMLRIFTEKYSEYRARLKGAFSANDNVTFTEQLSLLRHTLCEIHADETEKKCAELLSAVETGSLDAAANSFDCLITAVSALSIDLQMLMYRTEPDAEYRPMEPTKPEWLILAVDDVPLVLNILKTILNEYRIKLICVTSGADALKYIRVKDPDLYLLDIEMPEMDGYELAEKIRESKKGAPIIFLTGNAGNEYVKKAVEAGASDFIVKPVYKEQVLKKISKYLTLV